MVLPGENKKEIGTGRGRVVPASGVREGLGSRGQRNEVSPQE